MRIGELLVEQRKLRQSDLARALQEKPADRRLCSFLIARGLVDFDDASRALGEQKGVACALAKHLAGRDQNAAFLIPAELGRAACALPIGRKSNGTVIVCVREPSPSLLAQLQAATRAEVLMVIAPANRLEHLVLSAYGQPPSGEFDIDFDTTGLGDNPLPPLPDLRSLDPASVRLSLTDLDDARVDRDPSQSNRMPAMAPPTRPSSPAMGVPTVVPSSASDDSTRITSVGMPAVSESGSSLPVVRSPSASGSLPAMRTPESSGPMLAARPSNGPHTKPRATSNPPMHDAHNHPTPERGVPILDAHNHPTPERGVPIVDLAASVRTAQMPVQMPAMGRVLRGAAERSAAERSTRPMSVPMMSVGLEHTTSREGATDLVLAYVATRWVTGLVFIVRDRYATGYRGHGVSMPELVSVPLALPSTVSVAVETRFMTADQPASPAQEALSRALGEPGQLAAAPVLVGGQPVAVIVVGDVIDENAETSPEADLGLLADSLSSAYTRLGSR